jgi:prepilin-type N-terminal cleavage/methylation domain-containing protein/prepilin-type processing-associated H-X9-DG protein
MSAEKILNRNCDGLSRLSPRFCRRISSPAPTAIAIIQSRHDTTNTDLAVAAAIRRSFAHRDFLTVQYNKPFADSRAVFCTLAARMILRDKRHGRMKVPPEFRAKRRGFMRNRVRGFTLIEILVVVAIIALLSALLFPALSRAREGGRTKVCLSNMKQLGLAFQQYVQDAGRRYPGAGVYTAFGGHTSGWAPGNGHWVSGPNVPLACLGPDNPTGVCSGKQVGDYIEGNQADVKSGALFPYVRSDAVYICPSNSDGRKKLLTYTMNCAISRLHDVRITQPTEIVLLVDEEKANDGYFFAVNDTKAGSTVAGKITDSTDALVQYHNGGGNLLFCDGHAKFYAFSAFPLDASEQGKNNKWRDSGAPRFHDRTFGPWGSAHFGPTASTPDACNATKRDP